MLSNTVIQILKMTQLMLNTVLGVKIKQLLLLTCLEDILLIVFMAQEVIIQLGYGITVMDMEMFLVMDCTAGVMDMTCFGLDHFIITFITDYSFLSGIILAGMATATTMEDGQVTGMEMDLTTIIVFTVILT